MAACTERKGKKLLLITTSAGGGHIQAAKAEAMNALAKDPQIQIIQKDLFIDLLSKRLGKLFVAMWNYSQKKGKVKLLMFLQQKVPIADFLFGAVIFPRVFFILLREGIDRIVDTQPVGTSAIIKAIKCARKLTGKPLILEKIVTELPTDNVVHFFRPIKRLSPYDRSFVKLISTTPLLESSQSAEHFWKKNCGLSETEVCYESFPLRPSFKRYLNVIKRGNERMGIQIDVQSSEEKFLIADTMKRGSIHSEIYRDKISMTIEPTDKVSTILLGSQPTQEATLKYVKNYIDLLKNSQLDERHLLFVFCNLHTEHKNTLLRKVHTLIHKTPNYPVNLNVIPMCFQNDQVIASLYYRSDATFTRSGGLTAMELMSVAQGQIWIHSETHGSQNEEDLKKGMPIWEQGNALYLRQKKGALFITPDTFSTGCSPFFISQAPITSSA